jgi:predicted ATPase
MKELLWGGGSVEIVGFLCRKKGVVENLSISLDRPVTVLYGLNGTGKTTLLSFASDNSIVRRYKWNEKWGHSEDAGPSAQDLISGLKDSHRTSIIPDFQRLGIFHDLHSVGAYVEDLAEKLDSRQVGYPTNAFALALGVEYRYDRIGIDYQESFVDLILGLLQKPLFTHEKNLIEGMDPSWSTSYTESTVEMYVSASHLQHLLEAYPFREKLITNPTEYAYEELVGGFPWDHSPKFQEPFGIQVASWNVQLEKRESKTIHEIELIDAERTYLQFTYGLMLDDNNCVVPTHSLKEKVADINIRANYYFKLLLEDAPQIEFQIQDFDAWDKKSPLCRWVFHLNEDVRDQNLSLLSTAQRRWASLALQLASGLAESALRIETLLVIDEPESSLHRRAERHLARGLSRIATELDIKVCIASHSPSFLTITDADLIHVQLDENGRTRLSPLESFDHSGLDLLSKDLGISKADVLQFIKTIVLVEGQHDKAVIESWCPELREYGVYVIPIGGVDSLKQVKDFDFIFKFTDSKIVALVDSIKASEVSTLWEQCVEAKRAGRKNSNALLKQFSSAKEGRRERETLATVMRMALETDLSDRFQPWALSKRDVAHYLDPYEFCPSLNEFLDEKEIELASQCESQELRTELVWKILGNYWQSNHLEKEDFKAWFGRTTKAWITTERVEQIAIKTQENIHPDFINLSNHLTGIKRLPR